MSHQVIISGAPTATGASRENRPYPRRPIEELIQDTRQFSLYALALDAMQKAPRGDFLSYYEIAGIHGAPNTPWDQVPKDGPATNGYCTHANPAFPSWHRPYILLFEQALVTQALRIAAEYQGGDAAEWQQAAASLRAPYWDWAVNAIPPAEVIELASLTVTGPQGEVTLDPNPLLGYVYKDGENDFDQRPATVRCPTQDNPNESNVRAIRTSLRVLDNENDPMRDRVYNAIADATSWTLFSNKATALSRFRNSLESVHDDIHVLVGGNGQMSDPRTAAFDPIFWLHHTQVDRLLSLWQALHPNAWFTGTSEITTQDSAALHPFWNGESTFFTSADVQQFERFGYTYPEFLQIEQGADPRQAIAAEIKRLYLDDEDAEDDDTQVAPEDAPAPPVAPKPVEEPIEPAPPAPEPEAPPPAQEQPQVPVTIGGGEGGAPQDTDAFPITVQHGDGGDSSGQHRRLDWFIRIRVPFGAMDSSFTVLFFFGAAPEEEHEWRIADNLIGVHTEFVNTRPGECVNCVRNQEGRVVTEGIVRLTRALRHRELLRLPTAEIDQYLRDELQWRIQKIDASVIDPSTIEGLEVAVMTVPLEFSGSRGGWRKAEGIRPNHRNLTSDRAGGRARRE